MLFFLRWHNSFQCLGRLAQSVFFLSKHIWPNKLCPSPLIFDLFFRYSYKYVRTSLQNIWQKQCIVQSVHTSWLMVCTWRSLETLSSASTNYFMFIWWGPLCHTCDIALLFSIMHVQTEWIELIDVPPPTATWLQHCNHHNLMKVTLKETSAKAACLWTHLCWPCLYTSALCSSVWTKIACSN